MIGFFVLLLIYNLASCLWEIMSIFYIIYNISIIKIFFSQNFSCIDCLLNIEMKWMIMGTKQSFLILGAISCEYEKQFFLSWQNLGTGKQRYWWTWICVIQMPDVKASTKPFELFFTKRAIYKPRTLKNWCLVV